MSDFEHGGNLDEAIKHYGGTADQWLDLSTGINRHYYHMPIDIESLRHFPTQSEVHALQLAAKNRYQSQTLPIVLNGVQSAIQSLPYLLPKSDVRYLWPSYNEYVKNFENSPHQFSTHQSLKDLEGADCAIIVNPNNPTAAQFAPDILLNLAQKIGFLIIDESFIDGENLPSLAPLIDENANILILRSFGKYYGLAGLRLGFAMGNLAICQKLKSALGPWPISALAYQIGIHALNDEEWHQKNSETLTFNRQKCDKILQSFGLKILGKTQLFTLIENDNPHELQKTLAMHKIWTRVFSYDSSFLRLGMPSSAADWAQFEGALAAIFSQGDG